jgi:hypothetical protein
MSLATATSTSDNLFGLFSNVYALLLMAAAEASPFLVGFCISIVFYNTIEGMSKCGFVDEDSSKALFIFMWYGTVIYFTGFPGFLSIILLFLGKQWLSLLEKKDQPVSAVAKAENL